MQSFGLLQSVHTHASLAWKESHYLRQILLQISGLEAAPEFRGPSPSRLG